MNLRPVSGRRLARYAPPTPRSVLFLPLSSGDRVATLLRWNGITQAQRERFMAECWQRVAHAFSEKAVVKELARELAKLSELSHIHAQGMADAATHLGRERVYVESYAVAFAMYAAATVAGRVVTGYPEVLRAELEWQVNRIIAILEGDTDAQSNLHQV